MRESRFTHLTRLKRPLLIGAAVWVATQHPAHAADEIQVYNAAIAAVGQFTVQQHLNYTPLGVKEPPFPGGLVSNGAINGTPEFAYGLTDWWEVGLYLPFAIQNQTFVSDNPRASRLVPESERFQDLAPMQSVLLFYWFVPVLLSLGPDLGPRTSVASVRCFMRIRILVIGALLALSPTAARAAATCDEFEAAMIEGAKQHQAPPPTFRLEHVNSADANNQFFSITMFDDARAAMSCWHGEVDTFAADGNSAEPMSILHTMLLAGIGLHGYGLEWRQALQVRDQLVSLAKASDRQVSEVHVAGGKVSLVISIVGPPREGNVVGVPTFQIDTDR